MTQHTHNWTLEYQDAGLAGNQIRGVCECGDALGEDQILSAVMLVFGNWPPDVNEPKTNRTYLELDTEEQAKTKGERYEIHIVLPMPGASGRKESSQPCREL